MCDDAYEIGPPAVPETNEIEIREEFIEWLPGLTIIGAEGDRNIIQPSGVLPW